MTPTTAHEEALLPPHARRQRSISWKGYAAAHTRRTSCTGRGHSRQNMIAGCTLGAIDAMSLTRITRITRITIVLWSLLEAAWRSRFRSRRRPPPDPSRVAITTPTRVVPSQPTHANASSKYSVRGHGMLVKPSEHEWNAGSSHRYGTYWGNGVMRRRDRYRYRSERIRNACPPLQVSLVFNAAGHWAPELPRI